MTRVTGVRSSWPSGTGCERHVAHPAPFDSGASGAAASGRIGSPRNVERSAALTSPIRISRTRLKPCVMTSMFDWTTESPSRPNFFRYCARTTASNCSRLMSKSWSSGETPKKAPRNALPCIRNWRSVRLVALRAISNPASVKTRMLCSTICERAQSGSRSQASCGSSSDSQMRAPPSDIPSSGLVWVNAFGSQQSTTLTWRRSQFTRIRSGATTRKYEVGAPFFSDPYFGLALTWMTSLGRPNSSVSWLRAERKSLKSPMMAPRFLPVVIAPHPPMEWNRTAIAPSGSNDGFSSACTS